MCRIFKVWVRLCVEFLKCVYVYVWNSQVWVSMCGVLRVSVCVCAEFLSVDLYVWNF